MNTNPQDFYKHDLKSDGDLMVGEAPTYSCFRTKRKYESCKEQNVGLSPITVNKFKEKLLLNGAVEIPSESLSEEKSDVGFKPALYFQEQHEGEQVGLKIVAITSYKTYMISSLQQRCQSNNLTQDYSAQFLPAPPAAWPR